MKLCVVYLFSFILLVSSNPLSQLVQSCNVCHPTSYSNPTSIPIAVQQPSNTSPYPQTATVQVPAAYSGPLGDTLNQIILSRFFSNPSLQKISDPNTKVYNQNGDEVVMKVQSGSGNTPNVINNYFIVPPEFFNLNETTGYNDNDVIDKIKRPRRRKLKRKINKTRPTSMEDEEEVIKKKPSRRQNKSENVKSKRKLIVNDESDERDDLQETVAMKVPEVKNKRKQRLRKKKQEQVITPTSVEESIEDFQELDLLPIIERKEKKVKGSKDSKTKPKGKALDDENESLEIIPEVSKTEVRKKESDHMIELAPTKKNKKNQRKESLDKILDDKVLGNIEIPTDISNKGSTENRPTRNSKKNIPKKEPELKVTKTPKKQSNITPFPDDVLKNFFPYMPMGNYYNPNSNYPYNFDKYYQHLNPVRNPDVNRNKKRRKNQIRKNNETKNNEGNSNTHTIEIKLKPKKKEYITETPETTENPEKVQEVIISLEVEQSTDSNECVTSIPMEKPHKVFPVIKDDVESSSKESYETFSKLEDQHELITPELGKEDDIPPLCTNGIINDYYPIFDVDVYYNPYAEKVTNLEDNRYFYDTKNQDKTNRERRKPNRYVDAKDSKADKERDSQTDTKSKIVDPINKFDHNEYLDNKQTFSDFENENDVKTNDVRRVKVPSKNTRVIAENVETVFAGSKVAKYGVASDETMEDSTNIDDGSYTSDGNTAYVVAKSLGRPKDYW